MKANLRGTISALIFAFCLLLAACGGGVSSGSGSNGNGGNGGGTNSQSNPPAQPANLAATTGNAQVALMWNSVSGAASYNVKRSTVTGGPYMQIANPTTTSFSDTGVTNGTTYFYVVSALNSSGESANSAQASATPVAAVSVPSVPAGLSASAGNQQVSLNWNASTGATSYNVKRSTVTGGPYTQIANPTTTSFSDTGLTNGTTYFYVVSALNSAGESANSVQNSATPTASSSGNSYALPPDRITVWNPGMMSKGGIPSANWPVCNSTPLTPSGTSDDSAQINNKISQCAPGTVVQLGPGTFLMGQGDFVSINKGVVLRGAGAGSTILKNPRNVFATTSNQAPSDTVPIVIIGPGRWVNPDGDARNCTQTFTAYQTSFMQLLSADGAKGATSVTVANGSIFSAGQMVLLDETSGASWQTDIAQLSTSVWASPDYAVVWMLHQPAFSGDDPMQPATSSASNNFAGTSGDASCWFSRQDRPQNEIKEVASVSGNTVTFTSPLHKDYRTSHFAELTTYTGGNAPVKNAGLEKLTVVGGGDGAVRFENAEYSWAKNIEVTEWYGEGVAIDNSFRVELRDSYIHDASWAEPGGAGYAISLANGSSEILVENNISVRANKVMVARSSGAGSVVGYNYMDNGYIATTEGWIEIGLNASHMVGSHHVLIEGNQSFDMDSDETHGNATSMTYFRNWATTVRSKFTSDYTGNTIDDANNIPGSNGPKRAAGAIRYSYWMNFVGNVLGESGVTTTANGYVDDQTSTNWGGSQIWLMGWNDVSPYTVDTNVAATAIRDGNWDWLLGRQTWLTNPSAAGTLPDSLYLTSKPAFFGSNPWPWVDPTTGTTFTLPAKARFDAGTPNVVP